MDLPTLIITAIASAVAAYVTSKVWAPGTLASAAFTPVLVALVKEGLRRPTQAVTTVVPPVRPRARRQGGPGAPGAPAAGDALTDLPRPAIVAVEPPPVTSHRTAGRRLRWRIALITGLLGFAVCAAVYTVPELLTRGQGTTLFGGGGATTHVTRTIKSTTVIQPGKTVTTTAPTTPTTPAQTQTQTQSTSSTASTPTVTTTVTTPPATTTPAPTTTGETTPTTTAPDASVNPVP